MAPLKAVPAQRATCHLAARNGYSITETLPPEKSFSMYITMLGAHVPQTRSCTPREKEAPKKRADESHSFEILFASRRADRTMRVNANLVALKKLPGDRTSFLPLRGIYFFFLSLFLFWQDLSRRQYLIELVLHCDL